MAPPAGHMRPGRYLSFFVLIVVVLYGLVVFTGNGKATPNLGIDLQGGTRVTLTAKTPDGGEASKQSLEQARQIIDKRVNGIGVSGAEVVLDGSNIVITVPGDQGEQAKNLGRTAKLAFRKVVQAQPIQPAAPAGQQPAPPAGGGASGGSASTQAQPVQAQPPPTPPSPPADPEQQAAQAMQAAKQVRQNPALIPSGPQDQAAAAQAQQQALAAVDCNAQDPLAGSEDPNLPLVTCDQKKAEKYVLAPVFLPGEQVSTAQESPPSPSQGKSGWTIDLQFKGEGSQTWADFTSKNIQQRAAFVLDSQVVSAPTIQSAQLDGKSQISGDFDQASAKNLADILKYGSLPLSFSSSDATTVSATLGLASLEAGLIAGAIGLALVFLYCLAYYRLLGVLTILSLALSGLIVYGVLVLLGRWIGFTLDLAGVAGFIIAIGITADSFVVYFERLKDEIREGRSFRSAVSRGWVRARRTILGSDAVVFLAAVVLYALAVGEVQGFAFTSGMSTVLDLIVVFLVTHPLVALASRSKTLSSPKLTGFGAVQQLGKQRRAAKKPGGAAPKEA